MTLVTIPHGGLRTYSLKRINGQTYLYRVTIPHGGLRTKPALLQAFGLQQSLCHHPTRWAQNLTEEEFELSRYICHHPTRWAQNKQTGNDKKHPPIPGVTIPHGGLRTIITFPYPNKQEQAHVTIPHGGLRTAKASLFPQEPLRCHHPTRWAQNFEYFKHFLKNNIVTIPHGGLRTSNDHIKQNKTYQ